MKKLKLFFGILFFTQIFFSYSTALAQTPPDTNNPLNTNLTYSGPEETIRQFLCTPSDNGAQKGDLYTCINKIYKFSIALASIIAVFFIVIGGYLYMSSEGNGEAVDKAKSILASSITALVILLSAFLLLKQINPDLIKFQPIQIPKVYNPNPDTTLAPQDIPTNQVSSCAPSGTNSGNYYRFSQCNGPWANTPYGNCDTSKYGPSTIGTSACGPSSLATVIKNYMDQNKIPSKPVDPAIIAKLSVDNGFRICGNGTAHGMFPKIAAMFGLTAKQVPWSTALESLKKGTPVIGAMGPGYFTDGGHFVTFYGIDSNGNVLVADSGPRNITTASVSIIQSQIKAAFIIYP